MMTFLRLSILLAILATAMALVTVIEYKEQSAVPQNNYVDEETGFEISNKPE